MADLRLNDNLTPVELYVPTYVYVVKYEYIGTYVDNYIVGGVHTSLRTKKK